MDVIQNVTSILTADLLKSSLGSPTSNTVVTPYFMIPIIVLAYIGTKHPQNLSDNQYNSKNLVHLNRFRDQRVQLHYGASLHNITENKSVKILNKIFINNTYRLIPELNEVADRIGFNVEYLDMKYRYVAQEYILSFLKEQGYTKQNLPRFPHFKNVPIVLLNGAEFRGDWEYPYDIKYLKKIRFWSGEYRYKSVEAMHFEAVFPYAEYCEMQIVVVPYSNNDNNLALMIVLPNNIRSLNKILNQLENYQSRILNTKFEFRNGNVDIPIFKLEEKGSISNVLYKMCFGALFRSNASLNNFLTNGPAISLDNINHHVELFVNGTVTNPENIVNHCADETDDVIDFKVNRPFLFYILDMVTRVPYFSGLVKNFAGNGTVNHSDELKKDKNFLNDKVDCKKI